MRKINLFLASGLGLGLVVPFAPGTFGSLPGVALAYATTLLPLWAQIAAPLACIVITLFAIPAGIATGRQSVFKGIVGALGMFFAFYALTIAFMVLANLGWCPPVLAAFLPDGVFFLIGCRLFWRQR